MKAYTRSEGERNALLETRELQSYDRYCHTLQTSGRPQLHGIETYEPERVVLLGVEGSST
jgi:sRNA-binding regulator protein Hfq